MRQYITGLLLLAFAVPSWPEAGAPYGISVTQLINKMNEIPARCC